MPIRPIVGFISDSQKKKKKVKHDLHCKSVTTCHDPDSACLSFSFLSGESSDPVSPLLTPLPLVSPYSGTSWEPFLFIFPPSFTLSSPLSYLPIPLPPSSHGLCSEPLALSSPSLLLIQLVLANGHVPGLWCANPVLCYQCGCHLIRHWGSRQGGLLSTSVVSCTCSWVCQSLLIASWHPLKLSPLRYCRSSYLQEINY